MKKRTIISAIAFFALLAFGVVGLLIAILNQWDILLYISLFLVVIGSIGDSILMLFTLRQYLLKRGA